jgi:tetratricopeptide (TPR) repeat protein
MPSLNKSFFLFIFFLFTLLSCSKGQNLIQQGTALCIAGKYAEALPVLKQATQQYPDSARAFNTLGEAELQLGDTVAAIAAYNKALEDCNIALSLKPNDKKTYLRRAWAEQNLNKNIEAIRDYHKAAQLDPTDSISYFDAASIEYNLNDSINAIDDYTKAIKIDPTNSDAYYFRAKMKEEVHDTLEAIKDYDMAIKYNLNDTMAYFDRGIDKMAIRDFFSAYDDFSAYIKLRPHDAEGYSERASAKMFQNRPGALAESIADMDSARTIRNREDESSMQINSPYDTAAFLKRADYRYTIEGDNKGAMDDLNKYIAIMKNNPKAFYLKSSIEDYSGNYVASIEDINEAIKLDSANAQYLYRKAFTEYSITDFRGAIKTCTRIIELKNNNYHYPTLLFRAHIYDTLKEYNNELNDLEAILKINNKNFNEGAYIGIGKTYFKIKDYTHALIAYDTLINLYPQSGCGYYGKALVYFAQGDDENGCINFNKALQFRCGDTGYQHEEDLRRKCHE